MSLVNVVNTIQERIGLVEFDDLICYEYEASFFYGGRLFVVWETNDDDIDCICRDDDESKSFATWMRGVLNGQKRDAEGNLGMPTHQKY